LHSLATDHWPLFFRSTPHAPRQRGQVVRGLFPAGCCHPPTAELAKTEQGPISTSGPSISVCHQTGRSLRRNQTFLPTRRRRFVDHSHVARGAQGQGLQTCRPDGHRLECLFSRSRLLEKAKLNPAHMVLTVLRRTLPSGRGSPTLCHRGNASGPERPHNARVSRPRICRGSSNAAPIEPT